MTAIEQTKKNAFDSEESISNSSHNELNNIQENVHCIDRE